MHYRQNVTQRHFHTVCTTIAELLLLLFSYTTHSGTKLGWPKTWFAVQCISRQKTWQNNQNSPTLVITVTASEEQAYLAAGKVVGKCVWKPDQARHVVARFFVFRPNFWPWMKGFFSQHEARQQLIFMATATAHRCILQSFKKSINFLGWILSKDVENDVKKKYYYFCG